MVNARPLDAYRREFACHRVRSEGWTVIAAAGAVRVSRQTVHTSYLATPILVMAVAEALRLSGLHGASVTWAWLALPILHGASAWDACAARSMPGSRGNVASHRHPALEERDSLAARFRWRQRKDTLGVENPLFSLATLREGTENTRTPTNVAPLFRTLE